MKTPPAVPAVPAVLNPVPAGCARCGRCACCACCLLCLLCPLCPLCGHDDIKFDDIIFSRGVSCWYDSIPKRLVLHNPSVPDPIPQVSA